MKNFFLFLLLAMSLLLLFGCVTYQGRYDSKTPVDERSLIEIPAVITAMGFDGEKISWKGGPSFKTFPAGSHTFMFYFSNVEKITKSNGDVVYITITATDIVLTHNFEPGHHYIVLWETYLLPEKDSNIHVELMIFDKTTESKDFNRGVYSNSDYNWGSYLANTSTGLVSLGVTGLAGYVHDGGQRWGLYLDLGYDLGFTKPFGLAVGAYGGLLGQYFIPGTNLAFGAGGGYRAELFIVSSNSGAIYFPYVRAAFFPPRTFIEWYGYFDYYFGYGEINLGESDNKSSPLTPKKWGFGIVGLLR